AQLRQARALNDVDWGMSLTDIATKMSGNFYLTRGLANEACDSALLCHFNGNDREAFELVRDCLHLAELGRRPPVLMSYLSAISADASACGVLVAAAPAARLSSTPGDHGVDRQTVGALIAELLNRSDNSHDLADALGGDARFILDL